MMLSAIQHLQKSHQCRDWLFQYSVMAARGGGGVSQRKPRARACGGGCPARCVFHSSFPPARWRQQRRGARRGGAQRATAVPGSKRHCCAMEAVEGRSFAAQGALPAPNTVKALFSTVKPLSKHCVKL